MSNRAPRGPRESARRPQGDPKSLEKSSKRVQMLPQVPQEMPKGALAQAKLRQVHPPLVLLRLPPALQAASGFKGPLGAGARHLRGPVPASAHAR